MDIHTRFSVGDEVFVIAKEQILLPEIPCDICDGTGSVTVKGHTFSCPECNNDGYIKQVEWILSVKEGVIDTTQINYNMLKKSEGLRPSVHHTIMDGRNFMTRATEDIIFSTLDDAQKKLERIINGQESARI